MVQTQIQDLQVPHASQVVNAWALVLSCIYILVACVNAGP